MALQAVRRLEHFPADWQRKRQTAANQGEHLQQSTLFSGSLRAETIKRLLPFRLAQACLFSLFPASVQHRPTLYLPQALPGLHAFITTIPYFTDSILSVPQKFFITEFPAFKLISTDFALRKNPSTQFFLTNGGFPCTHGDNFAVNALSQWGMPGLPKSISPQKETPPVPDLSGLDGRRSILFCILSEVGVLVSITPAPQRIAGSFHFRFIKFFAASPPSPAMFEK